MHLLYTLNKFIVDFAYIFKNVLKFHYSSFELHVSHGHVFYEKYFIDYQVPITFLAVDCQ